MDARAREELVVLASLLDPGSGKEDGPGLGAEVDQAIDALSNQTLADAVRNPVETLVALGGIASPHQLEGSGALAVQASEIAGGGGSAGEFIGMEEAVAQLVSITGCAPDLAADVLLNVGNDLEQARALLSSMAGVDSAAL